MAEDVGGRPPRRRRRWLVLVLVLGAGAWVLRSRRAGAVDTGDAWPVPQPVRPAAVPAPVVDRPVRVPVRAGQVEPAGAHALLDTAAATPAMAARPSPRPRRQAPAGSAVPLADGSPPGPEYTIKGNADSMLFHPPTSPYFRRTKAEFWFRTAEDARAAGFTEWTPKKRTPR